jgi:uncharacterized membrane protein
MNRRRDIDWMRGIAVLCMIEHHTFDAFLRPELHGTSYDRVFRWIGGLAAPSFLFLCGLGSALALSKRTTVPQAGGASLAGDGRSPKGGALVKRALLIFVGAYLFRVQEWAFAFGGAPASDMLRIDILNCIGVALVAVALVPRKWWLQVLVGALVVVVTPLVWQTHFTHLPQHLADYLNGVPPRALFPIFPWIAHAFMGAACGIALSQTKREPLLMLLFAVLALGAWLLPQPAQWSDGAPTVFLLRDGLALGLLPACWLADRLLPRWSPNGPLLVMGRHSLVIYWVHVELVYGRWFWKTRGTLSLRQGVLALSLVIASMLVLAYLIDALKKKKPAPAGNLALSPAK